MSATKDVTMKRSVWKATGNPLLPTTVKIENVDKPRPGPHGVLIKTSALSINPLDWKLLKGDFPAEGKQWPKAWGTDVSGIVVTVGADVTKLKSGDEVYADAVNFGPMAEFCVVPADKVSLKPKDMSFTEAATIPLAGLTALQALRDQGGLRSGKKVCIFGGSGGTGTMAIQIAKALNASYVAATSSNVDLCKALGADKVVNYRTEDVAESLKGQDFDIVFDTVGGYHHYLLGEKVLKKSGGVFVTVVGDGGSVAAMLPGIIWRKFVSIFGYPKYKIFLVNSNANDLDTLTKLIEEGKLKATIDGTPFAFNDGGIKDMLEKQMGGRTKGKLVMELE
jgi:NADPH:quinone reductase-like Zn-dependent oxidoreductase